MIEERTFETILSKVEAFTAQAETLCKNSEERSLQKWMDNQDVCEVLNISKRTLQSYRENGLLAFSQIQHKILYKPEDVESLLHASHHSNPSAR